MIKTYETHHLVMAPDLNHHGTLFAGQGVKWFVESGFFAAANTTSPESTVCLNIHGLVFKKRITPGTMIRYESKVIWTGRTRLVTYVKAVHSRTGEFIVDGFLTFIHVDSQGRPLPHGLTVEVDTEEDRALQERVKALSK